MSAPVVAKRRCAVYTRKSTDEGLDQEYNSLEAQRDAGLAYIASQRHEGWVAVADGYDDPAYSGGNLERPALQRLMKDIEAGRIDIVVVYKIDRLTRSLADFARLVEVFDRCGVSFVSVTQQFNTTTSMGRLTLNVLLSFAQFEREVTGERIRDKIAASKAKGLWMGGMPPLGYDVVDRKLVVNEAEAELVRHIFRRYAEHGSAATLVRELAVEGRTTKTWVTQSGKLREGRPIDQQYLFLLLRNRVYLGEMVHKGERYAGQHPAIVSPALWDAAHVLIDERKQGPRQRRSENPSLLTGLLFAPDGQRMLPTYTDKKNGKRYRYYAPYLYKRRSASAVQHPGRRSIGLIPAAEIEAAVLQQIHAALRQPEMLIATWRSAQGHAAGAEIDEPRAVVTLQRIGDVWDQLFPAEQQRIARLLIERVQLRDDGLDIVWHSDGWQGFGPEIHGHPFVEEQRMVDAEVELA
ncbi:recombinase family protein [Eleftheria terrae]|uniref:recombinase family protein n=1 Tax=Eleftheria terrae TaxID=1597781 RepID=UPI00263AF92F|nr:recombinase family protein [Eleftheria terrae]WKB50890.1 recombinase family protein [Eleftheria terrae]